MARSVVIPNVAPPAPGTAVRVMAEGHAIAVFNVGGALRALDAACPHVGGPLEEGEVEDGAVVCPWHGSRFDLSTGAVTRGPATHGVRAYPVRVADGKLTVELP